MVVEGQSQDMEISSEGSTPTSEHYTASIPHHSLADGHLPSNLSAGSGSLPPLSATTSKLLQHSASRSDVSVSKEWMV